MQLVDIVDIEIRHAPTHDLARAPQTLERIHGLREWNAPTPMQQIKIETIGRESRETALARRDRSLRARVFRMDLADQEDLVATARDRARNDLLGATIAINFGGVDQRHAKIETSLQCGNLTGRLVRPLAHRPRAEAERGYPLAIGQDDRRKRARSAHEWKDKPCPLPCTFQ